MFDCLIRNCRILKGNTKSKDVLTEYGQSALFFFHPLLFFVPSTLTGACFVFRIFSSFFKLVPPVVLDFPPPLFLFDGFCVSALYRGCTVLETAELYKRLLKKERERRVSNEGISLIGKRSQRLNRVGW